MVRVTDSFNRGDNPDLGSAWDKIPNEPTAFRITTMAAVAPYLSSDAGESNNVVSWHADQWSEVRLRTISTWLESGTGLGVCVRASVIDQTFYRCVAYSAATEIGKVVTGTYTQLAYDGTTVWSDTDLLLFTVTGTALQETRNGIDLLGTTDATISAGRPGIYHSAPTSAGAGLTDWRGGDDTADTNAINVSFVDNQSPDGH